jgi:3-oxoacyl-[acyl-carrier-protein] synthase I
MRRVYITGIGFISSIGNSYAEVAESLRTNTIGIERFLPFDRDNIPVKVAGTIKGFDVSSMDAEDWTFPSGYRPDRALLRSLSPHGLFVWCALEQAIRQAGLTKEDISNTRTGLYTASAGSVKTLCYYNERMHSLGVERLSPKAVVTAIAGTLNFSLVAHYKIKGCSCGFVSACASSGHAMGFALDEIRLGRQDRMLVVGGEDGDLDTILPFAAMRALSPASDPAKASRPFDRDRTGFVATGGGVAMILESEDALAARGAVPLVEFVGWGQSSDGFSTVLPEPEGLGLSRAMEQALTSSGVAAEEVDYLNAHATATIPGDIAELKAIKRVFGTGGALKVSGTKSLTGHGLSMASILEAGITAVSLKEGFCPGTAALENPDAETEGLCVLAEPIASNPKLALSNSSGFGGTNVSLVFRSV